MPTRTRQPNTQPPAGQEPETQQQTAPRRRRKKRPPLSTVLFPEREKRQRRRRRRRAAPDNRAERRRQKIKRQRRYRLFYKVFTLVLILSMGIAALTLFFKVSTVEIDGRSRYSDAQLLATSGIKEGDNLFLLSKRVVRGRLFDEYPYLDTVRVERKLPNRVILHVADATPAAAVGSGSTYYYMDASGKLLEKVATNRLGSVPVVTGVTVDDVEVGTRLNMRRNERLQQLTVLLTELEKADLMSRVDFINLSDMENIRVGCDGHMYIRFGTMDRLDYKMSFAKKFVEETSTALYCELEVSGEILWEGRPSYRVIPVTAEDVAAQSRDTAGLPEGGGETEGTSDPLAPDAGPAPSAPTLPGDGEPAEGEGDGEDGGDSDNKDDKKDETDSKDNKDDKDSEDEDGDGTNSLFPTPYMPGVSTGSEPMWRP